MASPGHGSSQPAGSDNQSFALYTKLDPRRPSSVAYHLSILYYIICIELLVMFTREHIRWIGGLGRRFSLHGYMGTYTIHTYMDRLSFLDSYLFTAYHLSSYYLSSGAYCGNVSSYQVN